MQNYKNIIKKFIKYMVLFFSVFISSNIITKYSINKLHAVLIALIASTTFIIIDQYAPSYIIQDK